LIILSIFVDLPLNQKPHAQIVERAVFLYYLSAYVHPHHPYPLTVHTSMNRTEERRFTLKTGRAVIFGLIKPQRHGRLERSLQIRSSFAFKSFSASTRARALSMAVGSGERSGT
jgi:hypothetical protein